MKETSRTQYRRSKVRFDIVKIYKEIWLYKSFLLNWTRRELEIRYKGSIFGIIWSFINPLLSLTVFFFVFSRISKVSVPNYIVFLFSGMLCWNFFVFVITRSAGLVQEFSSILKRVYFPQETIAISLVVSGAVNFLISFGLLLIVMLCTHASITWYILWVPFILLLQMLFLYSTCLLLSPIGIVIRDLSSAIPHLLSLMLFITPVFYATETVSKKYAVVLNSQPMSNFISLYRNVIYEGSHPNWNLLLYCIVFNIIWYFFCHFVFHRFRYIVYDLV